MAPLAKGLASAPHLVQFLKATIQDQRGLDYHVELIPVHSPLLRESFLGSDPPLSDMLKLSGLSVLTSGLVRR